MQFCRFGFIWIWMVIPCWSVCFADEPAGKHTDWPRFRGAAGDGHVAKFPDGPFEPKLLWSTPLPSQGVGGVAATEDFVVVSSRSQDDKSDVFICLEPISGAELWRVEYEAAGQLDYGNSPRATPLIADPYVVLLGAFGNLTCVDIDSGQVRWKKHLVHDLNGQLPIWGYGWSPLQIDKSMILLPGGKDCAIARITIKDGTVEWQAGGEPCGYSSPLLATWNGKPQIVTFDKLSIGGWEPTSGRRLWTIIPPRRGDFNVPTPTILDDGFVTTSENNGSRRYKVDDTGRVVPEPIATSMQFHPDTHSPVRVNNLWIGADRELVAMQIDNELKVAWQIRDRAFRGHNSLIAGNDRLLVITQTGEAVLVNVSDAEGKIEKRAQLGDDAKYVLAHPALCGNVLFLRGESTIQAWMLWSDN